MVRVSSKALTFKGKGYLGIRERLIPPNLEALNHFQKAFIRAQTNLRVGNPNSYFPRAHLKPQVYFRRKAGVPGGFKSFLGLRLIGGWSPNLFKRVPLGGFGFKGFGFNPNFGKILGETKTPKVGVLGKAPSI